MTLEGFSLPLVGIHEFGWLAAPITILWIALLANLVNLIDGMDSLAAGIVSIAAFTFALLAASFNRPAPTITSPRRSAGRRSPSCAQLPPGEDLHG